ncbi:MAG: LytTR family transcriptional regulator [Tannerella sp.]|nr:LytTR family transcriptional regulator [Tannerella sp.]
MIHILHTVFSVFIVGVTNGIAHGICQVLYRDVSMQDFINIFIELFIATLIVSPVPVFVLAIVNYNRSLAFSLYQLQELNLILTKKENEDKPSGTDVLLTLTGATKESVELPADAILYVEACGNYVKINFREEGQNRQKMLRTTIKRIEDSLKDYPFIIRCHRAFMVNTHYVTEIKGNSRGYRFALRYINQEIPISRASVNTLKDQIGNP